MATDEVSRYAAPALWLGASQTVLPMPGGRDWCNSPSPCRHEARDLVDPRLMAGSALGGRIE